MGTLLKDDVDPDLLDQLIARANLRSALRLRFSDFLHGRLTLAKHDQLQAECLRVFGPRWREEIEEEDRAPEAIPSTKQTVHAAR